jgi:signal transduction histidine kinase
MEREPRILVVDDEPRGVELLARACFDLGEVARALSGAEALAIVRDGPLDLVITDQRMPGMTGAELLAHIAEIDDYVGRIVLTGYADLDAAVTAINEGRVHAYLGKPCDPRQLETTVRAVLQRVQLARENARLVGELSATVRELEQTIGTLNATQAQLIEAERHAAIGGMASMIVHDVRGPLSVVRSSGDEVVREGERTGNPALGEAGTRIVEESDRINRLCGELLLVARATERELRPTEEDLGEVVETALAGIGELAGRSGVRIDLDCEAGLHVQLDEDLVRRALQNLARNGIEAMPEGGVLRVRTRREERCAVISVIDEGTGIPDAIRDRLFTPFVTAGKAQGTGLGLTVVKLAASKHAGTVEVGKGDGDAGTAFHLRLPLDEPAPR